jgi:anti-sigma factor RsiW
MKEQHLSDEAVAAFADGVLSGHARDRARRHTATCGECARAVSAQREAILLLRAAPAPALPIGLFDRLVQVPVTTPLRNVPSAVAEDGSTMFAAFGTLANAAFVPAVATPKSGLRGKHIHPLFFTTAAVAAAGVLTVASASSASGSRLGPQQTRPASSTQSSSTLEDAAYLPSPQHAQAR